MPSAESISTFLRGGLGRELLGGIWLWARDVEALVGRHRVHGAPRRWKEIGT